MIATAESFAAPAEIRRRRRPLPNVAVGDAFDKIRLLPDDSVDCVVTSPPYWGLRAYGQSHEETVLERWAEMHPGMSSDDLRKHPPGYDWYRKNGGVLGLEPFPDWFVGHLVEFFEKMRPKLKPDASVWVNLGDTYFARWSSVRADGRQGLGKGERTRRRTPAVGYLHDKQQLLVPARFAIAMQDSKWILRNDLIWAKTAVPPRPERDRLRLSHEHVFHFVQRSKAGRPAYYYDLDGAESGARDVVQVNSSRGRDGHSATFPAELIEPRILSSSRPGGLVVDPFCGTGSTLEAAVRLGRRTFGIEMSPSFAASARKNLAKVRVLLAAHDDAEDSQDGDVGI